MNAIAVRARGLLQGEPLRAISYGAVVVVWLASRILAALHVGNVQAVDLDTALVAVTGAIAAVTELSRRWAFSPATVETLLAAATAPPVIRATPTPEQPTPALDEAKERVEATTPGTG
jgi:hypothetical protein